MRILLQLKVFIILALAIISCSGNGSYTVGYLNPSASRYRFVTEGNYMKERLQELGIETIIAAADDDDAVQLAQGYEMLEKGVDLLVIAPVNGNTIAPLVRDALSQGVSVVAYNRLINNVDYDLFVTGDNEDNARLFCEAALSRKPSGNYVIFGGDRFDRNGLELKQYIDQILKPHIEAGRINVIYETFVEGWNRERAAFEMEQVIQSHGTAIDAVIACNDPMGQGAYDALNKYNAAKGVAITGQDATLSYVQQMYNGNLTMTIFHPHNTLGYQTAELVAEILKGKNGKDMANATTFNGAASIPTFKIKSMAVTRENLEEVLVKSGEYTMEQVQGSEATSNKWE